MKNTFSEHVWPQVASTESPVPHRWAATVALQCAMVAPVRSAELAAVMLATVATAPLASEVSPAARTPLIPT